MEAILQVNSAINSFVWGPVMLVLIVGIGTYFTLRLKVVQITGVRTWFRNTCGLIFKARKPGDGSVTPFQAFTTAMAATAGTGNLVGVATAILAGGPGAIFWMWISGFVGMATKYAEIVLAVRFRQRNENGDWVGGPMYYITNGLGKKWRPLAVVFAFCGALCAFGIGNLTQINSIVGTTEAMLVDLNLLAETAVGGFSFFKLGLGLVLGVCVAVVIIGGIKRVGEATEKLVPFVGIALIVGCIAALIIQRDNLGYAFELIFAGAFQVKAAAGGVLGYTMMQAMRFGVARGVFTNEAGLGSAPIAHAAADIDHPVRQGMWGLFEVFVDTLVMCSLTALVILSSGVYSGPETVLNGSQLVSAAFKACFGVGGSVFLAFSVLIFAYCTTLSWSLYGLRCFEYLFGVRGRRGYQYLFCGVVVLAAITQITLAWDIADTLNGMMMIPNLVALFGLSSIVFKQTKDFYDKVNSGLLP